MTYPFPTAADDERHRVLGLEPVHYSVDQLDSAVTAWGECCAAPTGSDTFVRLLAVREGSVAEATVLWDVLAHHRKQGLRQYIDRSGRYYINRFGRRMLSERSCSRAMSVLIECGLLVSWPQKKNMAHRVRLDWVALHLDLSEVQVTMPVVPGLDGEM